MARRLLNQLAQPQRQELVERILPYLSDAVVDAHTHINHSGSDLLEGHREYIRGLETYLQENGGGAFVPLPKWDPATRIPAEFNLVKPADDGTARAPLVNLNPNRPLPAAFRRPPLCTFRNAAALGNALNGWHGSVHLRIGGAMGDGTVASAAPIFWCWHGFIDDVYADWQSCPALAPFVPPVFNFAALEGELPSGEVTPDLFERWARWGENLNLQPIHGESFAERFAEFAASPEAAEAEREGAGGDAALAGAIRELAQAITGLTAAMESRGTAASTRAAEPQALPWVSDNFARMAAAFRAPGAEFEAHAEPGAMAAAPSNRAPFRRLSQEEVWYPLVAIIERLRTAPVPVQGPTPLQAYALSLGALRNAVNFYFFPAPLQPMPAAYFVPQQLTGSLSFAIHDVHNRQFPS